jgi:hypothetical protein
MKLVYLVTHFVTFSESPRANSKAGFSSLWAHQMKLRLVNASVISTPATSVLQMATS